MQNTIKNNDTSFATLPKQVSSLDHINTFQSEVHISNFEINNSSILKGSLISNYQMIKNIKILTYKTILSE